MDVLKLLRNNIYKEMSIKKLRRKSSEGMRYEELVVNGSGTKWNITLKTHIKWHILKKTREENRS